MFRDLSEESTREILDGIDDTFIHRLFSPGVISLVRPSVEKDSFPIDKEVALAIIQDRRKHPFTRPDMPYPVGITAARIVAPYLAGSVQTFSMALSAALWKYYGTGTSLTILPAASGTLLSALLLIRKRITDLPKFQKHYPQFQFKSIIGGIDPITVGLICKYRKFYH